MTESKNILSHTADVRIKITSATLQGLFRLGLDSLNSFLIDNNRKQKATSTTYLSVSFGLQAANVTLLLIDFLSFILTQSHINKVVYDQLIIDSMNGQKLTGELLGFPVNSFAEDVKAVTYHEANIRVNEDGDWETILIFDV